MINGKKEIIMNNAACAEKADTLSFFIFAPNNRIDFIIEDIIIETPIDKVIIFYPIYKDSQVVKRWILCRKSS